jgi:hypothetical protein
VQQGTHDTLIEEEGFYRSIYDMQSKIDDELQKELNQ